MMTYSEATKMAKENKGISYQFQNAPSSTKKAFAFWCKVTKRVICTEVK